MGVIVASLNLLSSNFLYNLKLWICSSPGDIMKLVVAFIIALVLVVNADPPSGPNPTMPPDAESCTWGAACDGCNVWSEVNGVRYCCATNCDSGSLDVHSENGEVICW